ncbi:MAG TPA: ATP-binding protein [Verrucomicrobiae bacterium]|nr:ATP-binding protein [Verrucomicrobiae bacterium]
MASEMSLEVMSPADVTALLQGGLNDLRQIEFKPLLPAGTDAGREEFLSDISSFANASGGHIFYGVAAGLEKSAVEEARAWLEQIAITGITPRIPGLRFKTLELPDHRFLLAVRVPKTWVGPHMVVFRQMNRFYSRTPAGRSLLDVGGLRSAFALSESYAEKIRAFRLERINALLNRTLTVRLSEAPKTVLHILPLVSFQAGFRVDLDPIGSGELVMPVPMAARGVISHHNFDGIINFSSKENYAYSYVQLFRTGCLEAVESVLLQPRDERKLFPGAAFEKEIIQCGNRMIELLRALQIEPPYVVMLSFLGVRDYSMFPGPMKWNPASHQVERDHLFLDEVVIADVTQEFSRALRPAFDQLWNSCGWAKSLNYDQDGNWREATP